MASKNDNCYVLSYMTIRKVIGFLAVLIPFLMLFGGFLGGHSLRESISAYYYTNMQDLFVGILCAVALFLISYKGYETKYHVDNIATNLAGIAAVCVAFFPMAPKPGDTEKIGIFQVPAFISDYFHLSSAAGFFIIIAFISLFLFTRTGGKKMTPAKKNRNRVYVVCGVLIVFFLVLLLAYNLFLKEVAWLSGLRPVFFLESFSLFAFGVSWLVKGETLIQDA